MPYHEVKKKHRLLSILRLLASDHDYSMNDSVLAEALSSLGFGVPRGTLNKDLVDLEDMELVTIKKVTDRLTVATITPDGVEVSEGIKTVPGVKRPSPKIGA